eukprot:1470465-Pyramimonas_sp.AAC.1
MPYDFRAVSWRPPLASLLEPFLCGSTCVATPYHVLSSSGCARLVGVSLLPSGRALLRSRLVAVAAAPVSVLSCRVRLRALLSLRMDVLR